MKRFLVLGILLVVFGLAFSFCSGNSSTENSDGPIIDETSMWDGAIEKTIIGKIEAGDNKLFIIENWDSRSKVNYEIFGDLKKELEQYIGKYAKVKGLVPKIDEETVNWSKNILVQEIIEIYENPPAEDNY